ncbi:hypothetical protein [Streptomyces sp. bgisy153]|uniref:hypothetical protein n=1 Tax=Streptomyces sp. bgisy153 TaxID=3413793 RepID=UPI003D73CCC7
MAAALGACGRDGFTGVLRVSGAPGGVFHLRGGLVVAVESPGAPGADALLLRSGRIQGEEWAGLVREAGGARWPADGIVTHGYAGAAQLRVVCAMALRDAVFAVVAGRVDALERGPAAGPPPAAVPVGEPPQRLLQEAGRRLAALAALPCPVRPDRERPVPAPLSYAGECLSAERRELLAHADGRRTARDLAFRTGRGVYAVTVEVARMLGEGLLECLENPWPIPVHLPAGKDLSVRRPAPAARPGTGPAPADRSGGGRAPVLRPGVGPARADRPGTGPAPATRSSGVAVDGSSDGAVDVSSAGAAAEDGARGAARGPFRGEGGAVGEGDGVGFGGAVAGRGTRGESPWGGGTVGGAVVGGAASGAVASGRGTGREDSPGRGHRSRADSRGTGPAGAAGGGGSERLVLGVDAGVAPPGDGLSGVPVAARSAPAPGRPFDPPPPVLPAPATRSAFPAPAYEPAPAPAQAAALEPAPSRRPPADRPAPPPPPLAPGAPPTPALPPPGAPPTPTPPAPGAPPPPGTPPAPPCGGTPPESPCGAGGAEATEQESLPVSPRGPGGPFEPPELPRRRPFFRLRAGAGPSDVSADEHRK